MIRFLRHRNNQRKGKKMGNKSMWLYDVNHSLVHIELPTCKTCKWWDDSGHHNFGHKLCLHEKMNHSGPEDKDNIINEGYDGAVYYGPDFGCIHWEEKQ
jgi:hypothetical protein